MSLKELFSSSSKDQPWFGHQCHLAADEKLKKWKTLKRPHILFTPKWVMETLMGESACLLFDSIRAKPKKLTELDFQFSYSRIEPALKHLLQERNF